MSWQDNQKLPGASTIMVCSQPGTGENSWPECALQMPPPILCAQCQLLVSLRNSTLCVCVWDPPDVQYKLTFRSLPCLPPLRGSASLSPCQGHLGSGGQHKSPEGFCKTSVWAGVLSLGSTVSNRPTPVPAPSGWWLLAWALLRLLQRPLQSHKASRAVSQPAASSDSAAILLLYESRA